jgi:hypothetical protein
LFAASEINQNYVSMHLVAVYCSSELRKAISPELKKHSQGKACVQFTAPTPNYFAISPSPPLQAPRSSAALKPTETEPFPYRE